MNFRLVSSYSPRGDQATAIEQLVRGLGDGEKHQVLLGVTGSGKTFTMAKVIEKVNRPTLVLAHNKTLAAQLYHEFRGFFPESAVEYFVSYYDYYQPEAYIAVTDTYIEKESTIWQRVIRSGLEKGRASETLKRCHAEINSVSVSPPNERRRSSTSTKPAVIDVIDRRFYEVVSCQASSLKTPLVP